MGTGPTLRDNWGRNSEVKPKVFDQLACEGGDNTETEDKKEGKKTKSSGEEEKREREVTHKAPQGLLSACTWTYLAKPLPEVLHERREFVNRHPKWLLHETSEVPSY